MYATWDVDMGRMEKINFAYNFIKKDNLLFGYGLGASYYGESSEIGGYIYNKYMNQKLFGGTNGSQSPGGQTRST